MQNQVTIKSGAMHWTGAASVAVNPTTDDQFVTLNIKTSAHRIDLMLHIGVALEISGTLEDQVQDNLERIANDLTVIESAENEAAEIENYRAVCEKIKFAWNQSHKFDNPRIWGETAHVLAGMSSAVTLTGLSTGLADELHHLSLLAIDHAYTAKAGAA